MNSNECHPAPHTQAQQEFIDQLRDYLRTRGMEPKTLGVNEYDMDAPLKAIRRLMLESDGLITVAFRRLYLRTGSSRYGADVPNVSASAVKDIWLTSPYCQIEPAMAYQLGLPILILREKGVQDEGVLEKGAVGSYMPEFDLSQGSADYIHSKEWNSLIGQWEGQVRAVVDAKGNPPKLF